MKNILKCILIVLFLAVGGASYAQSIEDIVTDRPDQTESAITVPKGTFQAELGVTYEITEGNHSNGTGYRNKILSVPGVLLRYGIMKNFELRLGSEFISENRTNDLAAGEGETGLSNLQLGTKIQLFREKGSRPDASFIFHFSFPVNSQEPFQSEYIGTDFRLSVSHSLGERFSLSYNLGGEWDGDSPRATGIYTLAFGISISDDFSAYAESYGFLTQKETADHRIDGGFTYLLARNVQLDISGGVGITDKSPDYFIGSGLSFRLPK